MTTSPPPVSTPSRGRRIVRAIVLIVLTLLALLLLIITVAAFYPIRVANPLPSRPAADYDAAAAEIDAIWTEESETPDFNPVCQSILMTHGQKVERAIVFYHGFTSCPEQFRELGQRFFDLGYNVYIPLAPYHGLTERYGHALENLTAADLAAHGTETADIAQGLGEHVTVSGLSGGGAIAAWLAQYRADVDLAAPMAPFIGVRFLPGVWLNKGLTNLIRVLPNIYRWWDPINREGNPATAPYAYFGYPLRSMGTYMQLGFDAFDAAGSAPPASAAQLMIINASETSISNTVGYRMAEKWAERGGAADSYTLPRDMRLPHDFISVTRPNVPIDVVYPLLVDLLTEERP
jgi:alpha-beta hydrolase superfamily lysophospholipase